MKKAASSADGDEGKEKKSTVDAPVVVSEAAGTVTNSKRDP